MPVENPVSGRSAAALPREITGRFVLVAFLLFFGVIAAVNATMVTLAVRTMPGLAVKNSYDASQVMNAEFDAMRAQSARGWSADATLRLAGGVAPVLVTLAGPKGEAISRLNVIVRLAHPALTRADHVAVLRETSPGTYSGDFPDVQAGGWTFIIEAMRGPDRLYTSRNRIVLKE
jgi:nitrogen fixation protein FixH